MRLLKILAFAAGAAFAGAPAWACTSAIIAARATRDGRTIMWKHRDTDSPHAFVARHDAPGEIGYVALYNGGDTALREAWTGMNDAGFAIMNTASYNLPQDAAATHDREGLVMARALALCRSVDDFGHMLDTMRTPYGVEANFGVTDATGDGAYFETSDFGYTRYNLADAPDGVLLRTNHSLSGDSLGGEGYIRLASEQAQLGPRIAAGDVTPELLTEGLSRSWYHGLLGRDMSEATDEWMREGDFIPRRISAASIAIEGLLPGEDPGKMTMWTALGFPPCSHVLPVTLDSIPLQQQCTTPEGHSLQCDEAVRLKAEVFPMRRGSGRNYIHIPTLRKIDEGMREESRLGYEEGRRRRADKH